MSKKFVAFVLAFVVLVLLFVGVYALLFSRGAQPIEKTQGDDAKEEQTILPGDNGSQFMGTGTETSGSTDLKSSPAGGNSSPSTGTSAGTKPGAGSDVKSIEGLDASFCEKVTNPQGKAACMEEFGNN